MVPNTDSHWNSENSIHTAGVEYLTNCVSEVMKRCLVKPANYDKVKEVTQGEEENPEVFLNYLSEAFQKYTNSELEKEP